MSCSRNLWSTLGLLGMLALPTAPALAQQSEDEAAPEPEVDLSSVGFGQELDEDYTRQIHKFTTEPFFLTKYIDYLPASATVPSVEDVLGHIAGAADVLSYSHEVHRYMRAVANASPRVKVFSMGHSEEGREMILVVMSSEETIKNLDHYKEISNRLADPRTIESDEEARELIAEAKPIYWMTGAMHSPETGSPEMLMELVYRMAVDESDFIRAIRDNMIVLITPIQEVDGRDKRVDLLKIKQADSDARVPSLLYWGKYVAHDNNRDGLSLSLALSKALMGAYLDYTAQVVHDLHESVSYLYTSTGTGPYNAWIDPILIDEWHTLAYQEITEMTKMGVPGVWTHGFYDGWAPNYAFYTANGHNAIGRFYETQGAGNANTRRITAGNAATRTWYRPNPPLRSVMWSIRNNVNMQQSAVLIAINYMANNRETFMENFYLKSKRSVAKATTEGPAAYVFPSDDPNPGQQALLLNLLKLQGCEVHRADEAIKVGDDEYGAGSYIVRLDQPYSRMVDMMLDTAYYNVDDPRPYDDTGWTLGPLYNAKTVRVEDTSILDGEMTLVEGDVTVPGGVDSLTDETPIAYLINHNADASLASFRFKMKDLKIESAEKGFKVGDTEFNAGTFIIKREGNPDDLRSLLESAGEDYGFTAYAYSALPDVPTHEVAVPRIAVMHTWTRTQTEGWVRMAFDEFEIPYDYISVHEARDNDKLREKYDVIVMGPSGSALGTVRGLPKTGKPVAWKRSDVAPNIGAQDETDDMRGGLELDGVLHLRDFIQDGGTFITITSSSDLPIHFGLANGISIRETDKLRARGGVYRADFADDTSPIRYGYGDELGVYFNQSPVLRTGGGFSGFGRGRFGSQTARSADAGTARITGRGGIGDSDIVQGRPRDQGRRASKPPPESSSESLSEQQRRLVNALFGGDDDEEEEEEEAGSTPRRRLRTILRFTRDQDELLISGMLAGGSELAGSAAVADVPLGEGHIVMFAINPMWRQETKGAFSLVFNAMLHYDNLHTTAQEDESDSEDTD